MTIEPLLRCSDLAVQVEQKDILKGIDLAVMPGSVHVIMGPNGSGKSSLLHTLMGMPGYEVVRGTVDFAGRGAVADPETKQERQGKESVLTKTEDADAAARAFLDLLIDERARRGLFLAFQNPYAVPGVQIFSYLRAAHKAVYRKELTTLEFHEIIQDAFDAVNLDPSHMFRNLNEGFSGGEKKRLEMVQLLVLDPVLALLDEIDSGLDVDAFHAVVRAIELFKARDANKAIILVSHYMRMIEAVQPNFVHVIKDGRLVASGSLELAKEVQQRGYDAWRNI